ncbi:MAG: 50S ribosomal protein L20 [Candidatus Ureaplasma intestinipullorum]|uniref:Large ribosomal subunit protein bL20 n=1 Tax=Candidatus Ureaplasma intestinipullorum TaxID=2838770 RepID=A0A9E2KW68_9BACT|nr:50S ribosomal protein L20 [Candidatus Ureaplasma intestinipullorum]
MRVKGGTVTRRRHKAVLKQAEGTWGTRHTSYRIAKQTIIRAGEYAYRDRKNKKRDFRRLWISRINAAVRELGYTYSAFMHELSAKKIEINRKMLSELAINNPEEFNALVESVMKK